MPFLKLSANKIVIALIALAVIGGIAYTRFSKQPAPNFISVKRGDIAEEVIVTGTAKPVQTINLAFERPGKIVRVNAGVGEKVIAGEALAELEQNELAGQLKEGQANVAAAQAKLDALKRGTRPEDIQITRTELAKAEQDLANDYSSVLAALNDAYAKADDAAQNQLNALYANTDNNASQLTFPINDSQIQIDAQAQRATVNNELNIWKSELNSLTVAGTNSSTALDQAIKKSQAHLAVVLALLNKTMDAVVRGTSLNSTTVTMYKTSVTTGRNEVNTSITNLNTNAQTIASQTIVVKQHRDQLASQLAGATVEDIRGQEAEVAQASAKVTVIEAQLNQTIIRSPINGTLTRQDAKVGEITPASKSLVSVISADNLDIEANIPEVDIGKIKVSDPVLITFDAFPSEPFSGTVAKVDPAETIIDGVVNFKITVALGKPNSRLKSGLTANLRIEARKKTGVLILPQVAIVQNDQGTFVRKDQNGAIKDYRVEIGIRDQNGNVEILSGVRAEERVVNIGAKTRQ